MKLALESSILGLLLTALSTPARAQCASFEPSGVAGNVFAMEVFQGELYVGGDFTVAGGVRANRIARWDGTAWSDVAGGVEGGVHTVVTSLEVFDDGSGAGPALFVGGSFTQAGGTSASHVARWDGTTWSRLANGVNDLVTCLEPYDEDGLGGARAQLYVGGGFTQADASGAKYLARWDGATATWTGVSSGTDRPVSALATYAGELYVGGSFLQAGGAAASHLARWNGTAWSTVSTGTDGPVQALAAADDVNGSGLYVGGAFASAGGAAANRVARWNGAAFSPLDGGIGGGIGGGGGAPAARVFSFAVVDRELDGFDDVYVIGRYLQAGPLVIVDAETFRGATETMLARWNGSSWTQAGRMGNAVRALVEYGGALYAGGQFETVDGSGASGIARLDDSTSQWMPLGTERGPSGVVRALETWNDGGGDDVYAAGDFASAGERRLFGVGRWTGAQWTPVGGGTNATVHALRGTASGLYAGGRFTQASNQAANHVARWTGSTWTALGQGVGSTVYAIEEWNGGVVVGGRFSSAGGNPASHVAAWDGAGWSRLGRGTEDVVRALAVHDDGSGPSLFAGGEFEGAGRGAARHVARWDGNRWHAVGLGLDGTVHALEVFDAGGGPRLYAGGEFTRAGTTPAPFVARWDGTSWAPVGNGVDGAVHALVSVTSGPLQGLYVGGTFANAGASSANNVGVWNGTLWTAIGAGATPGTDHTVFALEPFGARVYVGGGFTLVDGSTASSYLTVFGCPP